MSGSLYGMQGMGTTGMGAGASPQIPPQLLALLAARGQQGGAQPGGFAAPPGPVQAAQQPTGMSPLTALMGQGQLQPHQGGGMGAPPGGGMGVQNPSLTAASAPPGGGAGNPMQLMQLLSALKGQQQGAVPPGQPGAGGMPQVGPGGWGGQTTPQIPGAPQQGWIGPGGWGGVPAPSMGGMPQIGAGGWGGGLS